MMMMKQKIITFLLCLLTFASQATTYFVSAVGSNSNNGTSITTPWQTSAQVAAKMSTFQPGDKILFRRGDIFQGNLIPTKSGTTLLPITFGAYGTGEAPVISGFVPVGSTWTLIDQAKGIYESAAIAGALSTCYMVTINNVAYPMGRFPNADAANQGWLSFDSHTSTSITDNNTHLTPSDWVNGEIVMRTCRFGLDIGTLSAVSNPSASATTFTILQRSLDSFSYKSSQWQDGSGYFMTNNPNTLDQFGEWWYNGATKRIRVCFAGNNPNLFNVQLSAVDKLIEPRASNIIFRDLKIAGANRYGVWQDNPNIRNQQYINCNFVQNGIDALLLANKRNITIDSSTFIANGSNGISFNYHDTDCAVMNSYFDYNGFYAQSLRLDDKITNGDAILFVSEGCKGVRILNNTIKHNGYQGIFFMADSSLVEGNYIDSVVFHMDDGAAIYHVGSRNGSSALINHGDTIRNNIVQRSIGAALAAPSPLTWQGTGIYLDDRSNGTYVIGNTAAFCGYYGIYLHNAFNMKVIGNKVIGNTLAQIGLADDAVDQANAHVVNNLFRRNQVQCTAASQRLYMLGNSDNAFSTMADTDSNFNSQPFQTTNYGFKNWFGQGSICCANFTIATWRSTFNWDKATKQEPVTILNPNQIIFQANEDNTQSKFLRFCGLYYQTLEGTTFRYNATLPPKQSVIMYRK
jgi:parallel beta-helix repeat protein